MTPELRQSIETVVPKLDGWCSVEKALAMAELIVTEKPLTLVEIGVFGGRSLIPQAMALQANGRGVIYGIDPWKKDAALEGQNDKANDDWWSAIDLHEVHKKCAQNIWALGLDDYCTLIRAGAASCVNLFGEIDTLHIDGNHSELTSVRDVTTYVPLVKRGGYIWFDDADWSSTQAALKLMEQYADKVAEIKTSNVTVLFRKRWC